MKEGFLFLLSNIVSSILSILICLGIEKLLDFKLSESLSKFLLTCFYLFFLIIIMRTWYKRR